MAMDAYRHTVFVCITWTHLLSMTEQILRRYICNVFFHWLRPCSAIDRNQDKFKLPTDISTTPGIILGMGSANETLQCNVASHWLSPYPEWSLQHYSHSAHPSSSSINFEITTRHRHPFQVFIVYTPTTRCTDSKWYPVYFNFFLGRMLEVRPHFLLRQLVALGWRRA